MAPMRLKDAKPYQTVVMIERMDEEVRETTYLVLPGAPIHEGNIPVARVSVTQGLRGQKPRFSWSAINLYRSEAHPLTLVHASTVPEASGATPDPLGR